jgi:hypothetical protein
MKTMSILLVGLMAVLGTTGFNCINDGFLVSVNLPVSAEFAINGGGNTIVATQGQVVDVQLSSQIDQGYVGKMKAVRMYDIRLTTIGTYSGAITGTLVIMPKNGASFTLADINGNWADFNAGKSVFQNQQAIQIHKPVLITVQNLQNLLNQFITNNALVVTLGANGTSSSTLPQGLRLRIEVLAQVDVDLSSNDNNNNGNNNNVNH